MKINIFFFWRKAYSAVGRVRFSVLLQKKFDLQQQLVFWYIKYNFREAVERCLLRIKLQVTFK